MNSIFCYTLFFCKYRLFFRYPSYAGGWTSLLRWPAPFPRSQSYCGNPGTGSAMCTLHYSENICSTTLNTDYFYSCKTSHDRLKAEYFSSEYTSHNSGPSHTFHPWPRSKGTLGPNSSGSSHMSASCSSALLSFCAGCSIHCSDCYR